MSKVGIVLGRMQPFHNGHAWLIEQALFECDEVYVFIGSADKLNERNPFSIYDRINFVYNYFKTTGSLVRIIPLDDLTSEDDVNVNWGNYLYKEITKNIKQDNFTLYTSENENFMKSWFSEDILDKINIEYKHRSFGISAISIRLAIDEKDFDFVSKYVPKNVLEYLKQSYLKIDENYPILTKMIDMETKEVLWECEHKSFDLKEDCLIKDKDFKESENIK